MSNPVKVIFLDRDGVINKRAALHEYIVKPEDFIVLPGVFEAIRLLNEAGFLIYVVSNQRCVSRGICTTEDIDRLNEYMCSLSEENEARIDGVYYCPHGDGECSCRKPAPGLFYKVEEELKGKGFEVDKEASYVFGDFQTDIDAGAAYGVKGILIGSDGKYPTLLDAARMIV